MIDAAEYNVSKKPSPKQVSRISAAGSLILRPTAGDSIDVAGVGGITDDDPTVADAICTTDDHTHGPALRLGSHQGPRDHPC